MTGDQERPYEPALPFRTASAITLGTVGFLSRSFLYALSTTETHGLNRLLDLLDHRKDETKRERGLITVSNHLSVYVPCSALDDRLSAFLIFMHEQSR